MKRPPLAIVVVSLLARLMVANLVPQGPEIRRSVEGFADENSGRDRTALAGRVVSADTGSAVADAVRVMSAALRVPRMTITDADGRLELPRLASGGSPSR
jgi:hypothetical protein